MQVVIALVVTPEGYPLAYEVLAGNTSDKTTLREFLEKIERLYGKAHRVRSSDHGGPVSGARSVFRNGDRMGHEPECHIIFPAAW